MIDLINKPIEEINAAIVKYAQVLETIKNKQIVPVLAISINIGVNYVNEKYNDLSPDFKSWIFVVIKNSINKIKNENDVHKIIDEFIEYYNTEYQNYINNLEFFSSEFDRDYGFAIQYIIKASN